MAICGLKVETNERYWSICYKKVSFVSIPYPCRKTREVTKYCYEFSVVHEKCTVAYSRLWGCCNGREYKWSKVCFGWFDAYFFEKYLCFSEPLESIGECKEGASLPYGGLAPGGPIDPGDVAPNPID